MLYHWYELTHAAAGPARTAVGSVQWLLDNPFNPLSHTPLGKHTSAACAMFERTTRRYDKPTFGITSTLTDAGRVAVNERIAWERPFCRLLHFKRDVSTETTRAQPKILLVAPMSGHYSTLLRGTVETFLPNHDVYITDWQDARDVGLEQGRFDLGTYVDYLIEMFDYFKGDVHVFAVCQPSVPVLAATAYMEQTHHPSVPQSLILAGGPVDTRVSPTEVNALAVSKGTDWFRNSVITSVPWPQRGAGRHVYPGFLQLSGFMTMNLDRHVKAHHDLFSHLVEGDGDSAKKHEEFYDEYLAVMDLAAEFFIETIDTVFVRHLLPRGEMRHRGERIDLSLLSRVALMTIEGGKDDITGRGQCRAAHDLTPSIAEERKYHFEAEGVGHYGIFNGSRFRNDIAKRISQFVITHDARLNQKFSFAKDSAIEAGETSKSYSPAPANKKGPDTIPPLFRL